MAIEKRLNSKANNIIQIRLFIFVNEADVLEYYSFNGLVSVTEFNLCALIERGREKERGRE